jgi:hypothetical protein
MQTVKVTHPLTVVDHQELVSDQRLNEVHGDVLLIRTAHATTICKRTAWNMRQQALTWLFRARTEDVGFIAGKVSSKGGRFQVITRNQAIALIGTWIFKELQH